MLKRDGKVYNGIVKIALLSILIVGSLDGLVDYGAHYRVKHSKN